MNRLSSKTDRIAQTLADIVVSWRWPILLITIVTVILAAFGARNMSISTSYQSFFSPDYPELVAFEEFQKTYSKTDNILFVIQSNQDTVFTPSTAAAIEELTAKAWKIPYATRVDSISNYQHSWANADVLTVENLYRNGGQLSPAELDEKRRTVLDEPLLKDLLISDDTRTTGVNVTMNFPEKSLAELPEAMRFANQLAEQIERDYPGVEIAITGISALNNAFFSVAQADAMTLMPVMYLLLILVALLVLRSFLAMLATVLLIALSTITAVGLAGHLGIILDPISMTAPTVILTLAVADSIHILVSMLALMRDGNDKITSLKESLRINFLPVSVTSITP